MDQPWKLPRYLFCPNNKRGKEEEEVYFINKRGICKTGVSVHKELLKNNADLKCGANTFKLNLNRMKCNKGMIYLCTYTFMNFFEHTTPALLSGLFVLLILF